MVINAFCSAVCAASLELLFNSAKLKFMSNEYVFENSTLFNSTKLKFMCNEYVFENLTVRSKLPTFFHHDHTELVYAISMLIVHFNLFFSRV